MIRRVFAGVSRAGVVFRSASVIVDNYGSPEEIQRATLSDTDADTDTGWEHLVDDPIRMVNRGAGGFSLLDPIGTGYDVQAAVARASRGEDIDDAILVLRDNAADGLKASIREQSSLFSPLQWQALQQFVALRGLADSLHGRVWELLGWFDCLANHWGRFAEMRQSRRRSTWRCLLHVVATDRESRP